MWMSVLTLGFLAFPVPPDAPMSSENGVTVELFADAPQIVTPTGIAVDSAGHVFVAESHTHFRPDNYSGPATDRIVRLLDTDGDGRADRRDLFHEGFTHVMDLELAPDGSLYVATRMDIHRMQDTDGDGSADVVTPVVTLETTGTYPHNGISGLCFNADGSLNFGLGENLGHDYTMVGSDGTRISGGGEGGSTWRVNADGGQLKKVTTGWWNPFGMCVDAGGRIFGTDNDPGASPPCRLIQIHEQADYGYEYRYGRTGLHPLITWTGDLPGTIPMISGTGEAPCGIISTERTNLPAALRDDLLVACWADHRIERFDISQPADTGQVTAIRHDFIVGPNDFRPVGLCVAPNGDIYVSDWVLASYQLHGRGRVWRIRTDPRLSTSPPPASDDHKPGSVTARIARLRQQAQKLSLTEVHNTAHARDPVLSHTAIDILRLRVQEPDFRRLAEKSDAAVLLALKRSEKRDEYSRSGALAPRRFYHSGDAWKVAVKWIADDRLTQYRSDLEAEYSRDNLTVREFLMVSAAIDRLDGRPPTDIPNPDRLAATALDERHSTAIRNAALRLLDPRLQRLTVSQLQTLLNHASSVIRHGAIRHLALANTAAAAKTLSDIAQSDAAPVDDRTEAIAALAVRRQKFIDVLLQLASHPDDRIARAALQALASATISVEQRRALETLSTERPQLREELNRALGQQLSRPGADETDAWLRILKDGPPGDKASGERVFFHPVIGTCGRCHQYEGRGIAVGPALSLISRRLPSDVDAAQRWLLETILQPDREMAPEYTPWIIVTRDGRQLTGLPRRKGGSQEAYLGLDGREFIVKKEDIEFHQESTTSIMPKDLLRQLTRQELKDLFAFLTRKQASENN